MNVMHDIRWSVWNTGLRPDDWMNSTFIPIVKKGNPRECTNYCTVALALVSHASKVLLKVTAKAVTENG